MDMHGFTLVYIYIQRERDTDIDTDIGYLRIWVSEDRRVRSGTARCGVSRSQGLGSQHLVMQDVGS